ncbi:hypothetical protein HG530_005781 [Fusarium avenaceum]|nr:hypothetical protein HG530_005781 [Fusarium avenaceum]
MDDDSSVVEQHGRDTGWVLLEGVVVTSHEEIKEQARVWLDTMKALLRLDRLGVGCTSSAEVRLEDVVEAAVRHTVLVKTIGGLGDLLPQENIGSGYLELDGIILIAVVFVGRLLVIDGFVLDVAADIAQGRVLEVAPECVNQLVGESCTGLGGGREGSEDSNKELSCASIR